MTKKRSKRVFFSRASFDARVTMMELYSLGAAGVVDGSCVGFVANTSRHSACQKSTAAREKRRTASRANVSFESRMYYVVYTLVYYGAPFLLKMASSTRAALKVPGSSLNPLNTEYALGSPGRLVPSPVKIR